MGLVPGVKISRLSCGLKFPGLRKLRKLRYFSIPRREKVVNETRNQNRHAKPGARFDFMTLGSGWHDIQMRAEPCRPNHSQQRARVAPATHPPATRSAELQR
jgi:hypothetical protein